MKDHAALTMKRYKGYTPDRGDSPRGTPVVGRLVLVPNGRHPLSALPRAPLLPVLTGNGTLSEELLDSAVGLVLCGDEKPAAAAMAAARSLPVLFLAEPLALPDGAFALLDAQSACLTVSPDPELLSSYFKKAVGYPQDGQRLFSPSGHPLQLFLPFGASLVGASSSSDGYSDSLSPEQDEESCFDAVCDYAPCARNTPMMLRFSVSGLSEEAVTAHLRGIYRGAVYTRMSLLLEGVSCAEEASRLLALCHRSFCELSEEGREFNGYIAKGLLLDTPLLALEAPLPHGFDFFCLDEERICRLLCGKRRGERGPLLRGALDQTLFRRMSQLREDLFLEHVTLHEEAPPLWLDAPSLRGFLIEEDRSEFHRILARLLEQKEKAAQEKSPLR